MNDTVKLWILGFICTLVIGAYGFAWTSTAALEDRLTRQLDIIERKQDQIITYLWELQNGRRRQ